MPSIFSRIIAGELPGTFVWKDERAVAFMSIAPMMPGPHARRARDEVDHWIDLDPALAAHLFDVAQQIGRAQDLEWKPRRIGLLIVGEEVPHTHLHVVPINTPTSCRSRTPDPPTQTRSRPRRGGYGRACASSAVPKLPTNARIARRPRVTRGMHAGDDDLAVVIRRLRTHPPQVADDHERDVEHDRQEREQQHRRTDAGDRSDQCGRGDDQHDPRHPGQQRRARARPPPAAGSPRSWARAATTAAVPGAARPRPDSHTTGPVFTDSAGRSPRSRSSIRTRTRATRRYVQT